MTQLAPESQALPNEESWMSWISSWSTSWSNSLWTKPATQCQNQSNNDPHEETDIIDWFNDVTSGTESTKNTGNILSQIYQQLSEHNLFGLVTNSKRRKAAAAFGALSHRIDLSYPPKHKLKPIDLCQHDNMELMKQIQYSVRHALAPYKKLKLAFRTKESIIALHSTRTLLRDYFDIPSKDIIIDNSDRNLQQFINKLHSPRFYLAVDHKNQKIILSIRGSATVADGITDINATAKPFSAFNINGYAHEGILASSKYIFDHVTIDLVKQCNTYPDYQVYITGHSLAAGVSALLGLMYYQHPIICKQNRLKVFAFASPPVLSKEFTDANIGMEYIVSIALNTDIVTRLSIQSVKQHNLRTDLILKYDHQFIDECLTVLDDDEDEDRLESERKEFLNELKAVQTPNANEQLFPLGRVLWYVPNTVIEDDVAVRRKRLMCLDVEQKEDDNVQQAIESMDNDERKEESQVQQNKRNSWSETWDQWSNKMPKIESSRAKKLKIYGANHYILCDATECRSIFQEFVVDFPESFMCHLPSRYLWACGTSVTGV